MDLAPASLHRLTHKAFAGALWLVKLILFLPDHLKLPRFAQAFVERRLDLLEALTAQLVMIRAGQLRRSHAIAHCGAQGCHDVRGKVRHTRRAAMGGRLRRALKTRGPAWKNLKTRATAILQNMARLERLARTSVLMRRGGLSRRASAHTRVLDVLAAIIAPLSCAAAGFDFRDADARADTS